MTTYYKVVDSREGKLLSPYVFGNATVVYRVGKWSKPRQHCGPLCVFKSLAEARKFRAENMASYSIYACEVTESKHDSAWRPIIRHDGVPAVNRTTLDALQYIAGKTTMLADRVKLVEQVGTPCDCTVSSLLEDKIWGERPAVKAA